MSKKQPLIIFSMLTITMLGFQNCAKVGVQDLNAVPNAKISGEPASLDPMVETQIEQPTNNNNNIVDMPDDDMNHDDMDAPNSPPVVTNPSSPSSPSSPSDPTMPSNPSSPTDPSTQPPSNPTSPVVNNPTTPPPSDDQPKNCRPMNQVRVDQENKTDLQTVSCLNSPNEKCAVICHRPRGNPSNAHNIAVGSSGAVAAHLRHGDTLGACESSENPSQIQICEDDEENHVDDNGNQSQAHGAQSSEHKACGKKS